MDKQSPYPPSFLLSFFRWYCHPRLADHIEGDLIEVYRKKERLKGKRIADLKFAFDILLLLRPSIIRPIQRYRNNNTLDMYKSFFLTGWRNLTKNKGYSAINIAGLAMGMGVALLIGLWSSDELSYNKQFKHYHRIAQVWQFVKFDTEKSSYNVVPIPLSEELRENYTDFDRVSLSRTRDAVLSTGDKQLVTVGNFVEPAFIDMFSIDMRSGSPKGLNETNSIMLSETLAKRLFGSEEAVDKLVVINNSQPLKVTAVYADFPFNSALSDVTFLAPWNFLVANDADTKNTKDQWDSNSNNLFVQLNDGSNPESASLKIRDIRMKRSEPPAYKPEFFLHPMAKWHLYSDFKDGKNTGGLITYVWLFGLIGMFVLILACINFMNLTTARSERRAREVGIRKSIGSRRSHLIVQFLTESFVVVLIGFLLSLILAQLALPSFNQVTDKNIHIAWTSGSFWMMGILFCLITGLLAGSYPALYLSSFLPVKVLKGTFKAGKFAALPRQFLVVLQFTVSISLVIAITVILAQIDFAKSRPIGYNRSGLIEVNMNTPEVYAHLDALRNDLIKSGGAAEVSASTGSITVQYGGTTAVDWDGKSGEGKPLLMSNRVTHEYGRTIGWQLSEGRDFSHEFSTDSLAIIINESALKLMNFRKPLEERVRYNQVEYHVIAVVKDLIKESPFDPVKPTFYVLDKNSVNVINIRLSPQMSTQDAVSTVESVFKNHQPASPFEFKFVDTEYERKFAHEERIGKLSGFFAVLAMVISSLGIFGLASFMAEQRGKEIGIKKVLGASVLQLWQMLSKDFVLLVGIALLISAPISYYAMTNWLTRFEYRIEVSWWIIAGAGICALLITLLTVSYQSLKAAMANPVKSLRSE